MGVFNWARDFLGYSEDQVAARKAWLEEQRQEEERLEQELQERAWLYKMYNNDPPILRLINRIRYHPDMRHTYIKALVIGIMFFLWKLLHVIGFLTGKQ